MRNSLKMTFFSGHLKSSTSLKKYKKHVSGNYFRNNFVSEGIGELKSDKLAGKPFPGNLIR